MPLIFKVPSNLGLGIIYCSDHFVPFRQLQKRKEEVDNEGTCQRGAKHTQVGCLTPCCVCIRDFVFIVVFKTAEDPLLLE